jgi:hypothetical protein
MDWKCGLHSRVPAFQVQSPEFKTQFHQKKKKKTPWKVGQAWWVTAVISSTQEAEAGESKVQYGLHSKTLSKQNKEQKGIF